jgi:hypothetical protein
MNITTVDHEVTLGFLSLLLADLLSITCLIIDTLRENLDGLLAQNFFFVDPPPARHSSGYIPQDLPLKRRMRLSRLDDGHLPQDIVQYNCDCPVDAGFIAAL